jgi:hypothetical protein
MSVQRTAVEKPYAISSTHPLRGSCLDGGICFCTKQRLATNQTYGFGAGKLLKFTYTENFDCIERPAGHGILTRQFLLLP